MQVSDLLKTIRETYPRDGEQRVNTHSEVFKKMFSNYPPLVIQEAWESFLEVWNRSTAPFPADLKPYVVIASRNQNQAKKSTFFTDTESWKRVREALKSKSARIAYEQDWLRDYVLYVEAGGNVDLSDGQLTRFRVVRENVLRFIPERRDNLDLMVKGVWSSMKQSDEKLRELYRKVNGIA